MIALSRPVMRYHGGKWRLAPWVIQHLPPHRIYTEAFGGAASVLLRKRRTYAEIYNDVDGEIVNVFRVLRDPQLAAQLERALRLTPFARDEFVGAYAPAEDPVEQARRTIVKSFMGFGTASIHDVTPMARRTRASVWGTPVGFRSNCSRSGSTPATDWSTYPEQIPAFLARLRGVVIEHRSALEVIRAHDREDTLHYVDPPYVHASRSARRGERGKGYRHEMGDEQHRELAELLHAVAGMVVLSGYPCDLYDQELYRGWHRVTCQHRADKAAKRTEALWLNEAAADRLRRTALPLGIG